MNRRTAIRNVVIFSAGTALLPSCFQQDKSSLVLKNISVTGAQEKILAALAEAIIPTTENFIGAKGLRSHEFILTMVDDCTGPEEQKKFTEGLKSFDKLSHDRYGQLFTGFTAEQKKSLLSDIENKKNVPAEIPDFYKTIKQYTVQSFTTSKEYMTDIRKYKMIPGPDFKGCVKV